MAGTQGSSYGSSGAAAAGNRAVTNNLRSGLNASGSSRTNSGYGNTSARSSVNAAAANAARMAAERATSSASQRTASSGGFGRSGAGASLGGFGSMREVADRIAASRSLSSNAADKTSLPGIGQSFGRGTNYSAADYTMAGYGAYKNPNATGRVVDGQGRTIASLAQPGSTFQKGLTFSPGDFMRAGYQHYQQAPSMQSTPQTALDSWSPFVNTANIVGGAYTQNVAGPGGAMMKLGFGQPQSSGGEINQTQVQANSEIPLSMLGMLASTPKAITDRIKDQSRVPSVESPTMSAAAGYQGYNPLSSISTPRTAPTPTNYAWNGSPNIAGANAAALNQAFNVNSGPKVAAEGLPGAPSVASVPSLPNYAPSVSVAKREPSPYDPIQQMAGYQNPARAFPSRPAAQPTQTAMVSPMAGQGQTFRSPASAAQYNAAMGGLLSAANNQVAAASPTSSDDPLENPLYMGDSTAPQKIGQYLEPKFETIADPAKKAGNYINGLLGGSPDGGNVSVNPNAQDALNYMAEKIPQPGGGAKGADQATQTEFKALSKEDRRKVRQYMKDGMSMADAIKKVKGTGSGTGTGTGNGGTQTAGLYYPQYYSTWAGLPSGQRYG